MSTKAGATDHLFLFTYGNCFLLDMVFLLIFSIYLFIYSKRSKEKQVEPTTSIYLCKSLVVRHGCRFNIHDLFVYFFKAMSTKAGGTDHLFLFTYVNHLLFKWSFRFKGPFTLASMFASACAFAFASNCNIVSMGCCLKYNEWNPFFALTQIISKNA